MTTSRGVSTENVSIVTHTDLATSKCGRCAAGHIILPEPDLPRLVVNPGWVNLLRVNSINLRCKPQEEKTGDHYTAFVAILWGSCTGEMIEQSWSQEMSSVMLFQHIPPEKQNVHSTCLRAIKARSNLNWMNTWNVCMHALHPKNICALW